MWGGLIFAALTVFAMFCYPFSGVTLNFWASVPPDFVYRLFIGHESLTPFDSSFLYYSFCVVVNSLLGAIFAIFWCFAVFIVKNLFSDIKKNYEK